MRGTRDLDYAAKRERQRDHVYRLKRRTSEVVRSIQRHFPSPEAILDLGTAEGRMLAAVKGLYRSARCIGIDYSFPLLRYGKGLFPGLNLVCADIQDLGFLKDESFCVVIATAVIEHVANPLGLLRSCHKVLRPSGIIIITSPHPFWERTAQALGCLKEDHQSVMSPRAIENLLRAAGLAVLDRRGFMLTPAGYKGEWVLERAVRGLGLGVWMANQLVVAKKS